MSGQAQTIGDIGNIVIKTTPAGAPLHINDVATVSNSVMPVYTVVTANGKPAVLLNIYRQPDSNTVEVANAVHAEIASLKKDLPPGVDFRPFYDQSELVNESIKSVRDAILLGLVLASLIMVLFLRDWGTSLVAGLVIPATIGVTFIALRVLGQSFNLMTLGGLAAAVGLVIDDAIVVVENIVMHRDSGQSRAEAIRSAIREIRVPLVGSTITPIVVFLPLISITGVTGVFFRALAVTVGDGAAHFSGAGAHLDAHAEPLFSPQQTARRRAGGQARHGARLADELLRAHSALHPGTSVGAGALHRPPDRRLLLLLQAHRFGSAARHGRRRLHRRLRHARRLLAARNQSRDQPRGKDPARHARSGEHRAPHRSCNSAWPPSRKPNRRYQRQAEDVDRKRSGDEVIADVRAKIKEAEPVLDVEFPQLLQDMIGDLTSAPQPVVIKLFSEDPDLLRHWAPVVASAIKKIPGVVDVEDGIENTSAAPP